MDTDCFTSSTFTYNIGFNTLKFMLVVKVEHIVIMPNKPKLYLSGILTS